METKKKKVSTKKVTATKSAAKKSTKSKDNYRSMHDSPLFTGGGFYKVKG